MTFEEQNNNNPESIFDPSVPTKKVSTVSLSVNSGQKELGAYAIGNMHLPRGQLTPEEAAELHRRTQGFARSQ